MLEVSIMESRFSWASRRNLDVQLDVPIQVVPPGIGRRLQPECNVECRQPVRFGRLADQTHPGFFGSAPALLVVASETRRHDIVPAFLPAGCDRQDVVEREIFRRKLLSAVLTRVVVT